MVIALRRKIGHDLRSEVLALAARRDRTLGEEFLAKLKDETQREAKDSKSSEAASKRLQLAGKLLEDGQETAFFSSEVIFTDIVWPFFAPT